jgi:hypothetical protein
MPPSGQKLARVVGDVHGWIDRAEAELTADPGGVDDPFPGVLEGAIGETGRYRIGIELQQFERADGRVGGGVEGGAAGE